MPHLENTTRFAANTALLYNEDGIDTLYIVVKATFNLGTALTLADEQIPPLATDVYWAEPGQSSLRYASDVHVGKAATDIIMVGHACAPKQKPATQLDVDVSVGKVSKTVRVFGDRQWRDGRITQPTPFTTMPLVYEKAFGGTHVVDGKADAVEMRNPVGTGFAGRRTPEQMNGIPLPNLEDPGQLIREIADCPPPACFGFCAPNWHPRVLRGGTYDDEWRTSRAPFLPKDFDKRSLNSAHADLIYPGFLEGDEPVRITHMHPNGPIQFDVPRLKLNAHVAVAGKVENPAFSLETLLLEPNRLTASLVFRAALPCDKGSGKIDNVKIALSR